MVDQLRPGLVAADVDPGLVSLAFSSAASGVHTPAASSASTKRTRCHGGARSTSWPRKVGRRTAVRRESRRLDELPRALHRVAVVGVRLVPLDLRELGRVLVRVALVAEVLRELVDPLEPADDQPLEIELVGDPEIQVLVEQVRVRRERLREAAAIARLEDRRLDLDEALAVEVGADAGTMRARSIVSRRPRSGASPVQPGPARYASAQYRSRPPPDVVRRRRPDRRRIRSSTAATARRVGSEQRGARCRCGCAPIDRASRNESSSAFLARGVNGISTSGARVAGRYELRQT